MDNQKYSNPFEGTYLKKILKKADLGEIKIKFKESLVMCHGTFDLVHPGHIRHLLYASNLKQRNGKLLVSITSDEHIAKGSGRPYFSEDLRAINLAVLEFVDFVYVDDNETPENLIKLLRPKIFVKGSDYSKDKLDVKTEEEMEIVKNNGGTFLFSPGDYVNSSTKIFNSNSPKKGNESIIALAAIEKLDFKIFERTLEMMNKLNVHIIGDTIVDEVQKGHVVGGFRKTPTPSVSIDDSIRYVGGAGIVAKHVSRFAKKTKFTSTFGKDEDGNFVINDLEFKKIEVNIFQSENRITTKKSLVEANSHKIVRLDNVDNSPLSDEEERHFISATRDDSNSDVFILADFRHGIFNHNFAQVIVNLIGNKFIAADSQVASRWGNILDFRGANLITPNEKEVRFALGDQESALRPLGSKILKEAKTEALIMTLGDKGLMAFKKSKSDIIENRSFITLPSFTNNVVDAVGSGDALLAYSSTAFKVTNNLLVASIFGSAAAALACENEGNLDLDPTEVLLRIKDTLFLK